MSAPSSREEKETLDRKFAKRWAEKKRARMRDDVRPGAH
jgi:hypothetical protein